jgi:hypothetical protein
LKWPPKVLHQLQSQECFKTVQRRKEEGHGDLHEGGCRGHSSNTAIGRSVSVRAVGIDIGWGGASCNRECLYESGNLFAIGAGSGGECPLSAGGNKFGN